MFYLPIFKQIIETANILQTSPQVIVADTQSTLLRVYWVAEQTHECELLRVARCCRLEACQVGTQVA